MSESSDNEEKILNFWEKNNIYSKSKKKNSKGKKFYFMDGPPYATGHIHMGTALNKTLKDVAMRSRRMQGYDVFDRPGYDTHGLPIEFQVEKEIGSKSKKDIEVYGVKKFIEKCKEYATKHIDVMNKEFSNLGVWMDWDNPYLTLDDSYIEAVWDVMKKAYAKKLLYLGKYPVHLCPRCETAVAYNEIEYEKLTDNSVYVKFPLKDKKNEYLIIWTTTPWTLPANTGVMVDPELVYAVVKFGDERFVIAEKLVEKVMKRMKGDYKIIEKVKGKDMEGWEYSNPLKNHINLKIKNGNKVILSSRYVTAEDGTGLVHCAPGHGKEDYEVGKEYGIDMPCPVGANGVLTEEAGKYAGKKAREVDKEIIEDLKKDNFLVYQLPYAHDYPLCWRCKTPLIMVSRPQWFLRITQIQKDLLKSNEKVNWIPKWMGLRMKAWLEGIGDWPISRERYWGTPLPIWECECGEVKVMGSIEELQKLSGKKKIGVHKPEVDEVKIKCSCKKEMTRVNGVFDVWFDSGVSSWAALGYPSDKNNFKRYWPADLNLEGTDQVRGWWNSQIILSQIAFDKKPFDNIFVHGLILDISKKKMSKSLGNVVAPQEVIDRYSRDILRYYLTKFSKGGDIAYKESDLVEVQKVFRILVNINNFIGQLDKKKSSVQIEDKWIRSRLYSTLGEVLELYNNYKFSEALTSIEKFLVFDLSRNYIQMIRDRADETFDILNEIRMVFLKMISPVTPFISEEIWQNLREGRYVKEESIHLSEINKVKKKDIDLDLENKFNMAMKAIELGLAERDKEKIGLKWPLASAEVNCEEDLKDLAEIIARQLNVKKINFKKGKMLSVTLNTEVNEELESEGFVREISRRVQAERKNRGLKKEDRIHLIISVDEGFRKNLEKFATMIRDRTGSEKLIFSDDKIKNPVEIEIKDKKIVFDFS